MTFSVHVTVGLLTADKTVVHPPRVAFAMKIQPQKLSAPVDLI